MNMTISRNGFSRHRVGVTIIELMVVITLLTAILGGTINLMSVLVASDRRSEQRRLQRGEIRRFADDLRRDLSRSVAFEATEDRLVILPAGEVVGDVAGDRETITKIIYEVRPDSHLSRLVQRNRSAAPSRDDYRVGGEKKTAMTEIKFESIEPPGAVRWTIFDPDTMGKPLRIVAVGPSPAIGNRGETQAVAPEDQP